MVCPFTARPRDSINVDTTSGTEPFMLVIRPRPVAVLAAGIAAWAAIALAPAGSAASSAASVQTLLDSPRAWTGASVIGIGRVRTGVSDLQSAGNILAVYCDRRDALTFRVSLVAPVGIRDHIDHFA